MPFATQKMMHILVPQFRICVPIIFFRKTLMMADLVQLECFSVASRTLMKKLFYFKEMTFYRFLARLVRGVLF